MKKLLFVFLALCGSVYGQQVTPIAKLKVTSTLDISPISNKATVRTDLGGTTAGVNLYTLTNPSAIAFLRINADNTVTARSAANFKVDLSLDQVANADTTNAANISSGTLNDSRLASDVYIMGNTITTGADKFTTFSASGGHINVNTYSSGGQVRIGSGGVLDLETGALITQIGANLPANSLMAMAAAGTLAPIANGTTGQVLQATTGSQPAFAAITSTGTLTSGATGAGFTVALGTSTITGTLPSGNFPTLTGDVSNTGLAITIGNLAITNAKIAAGTIDLTTKVTGTLPRGNGGNRLIYGRVSSDFTTSSTSMVDVTNASYTVAAADNTSATFYISGVGPSSGGIGMKFDINGPTLSSILVTVSGTQGSAGTWNSEVMTAVATSTAQAYCTGANGVGVIIIHVVTIGNGVNSGTIQLRAKTGGAGTITIKANSDVNANYTN